MFGISFCRKINCSPFIHVGNEHDTDVIEQICTNCEKKYYYSEKRKKYIVILLLSMGVLFTVSSLGYLFRNEIQDLFKSKVKIEEGFGIAETEVVQDSIVILSFKGSPSMRIMEGDERVKLHSDTLNTHKPGDYRIIYETKDTQYYKDIIILPKRDGLDVIPETATDSDTLNENSRPKPTKDDSPIKETKNLENSKEGTRIDKKDITDPPKQVFDCPDLKRNYGSPCADGKIVGPDCKCKGVVEAKTKWYADQDGDKKGDPNPNTAKEILNSHGKPEGNWVRNSDDQCPQRGNKGDENGCPTAIKLDPIEMYINSSRSIRIEDFKSLPDDKISWVGSSGLSIANENSLQPLIEANKLGKQTLNLSINGVSDNLNISESVDVCVKMTETHFRTLLEPVINYGQHDINNPIPSRIENNYADALKSLTVVFDSKSVISNKGNMWGTDIPAFLTSKIGTQGQYVKDVKINRLKYNLSTCLVERIDVEIKK